MLFIESINSKYFIYKKNRKIIEMFYYILKKFEIKNENETLYC